ncbi:D-lactate ferricytochrome c oxidoreductase, partial [Dinochytrium kinnereticum]
MRKDPLPAPFNASIQACLEEIRANVSKDAVVSTSVKVLTRRSHDVSYHQPHLPHAVVEAACEEDVAVVLRACNRWVIGRSRHKIPIIARAGGTSLEGHIIPTSQGGLVLDVSAMDKILAIHPEDMDVVVQPG